MRRLAQTSAALLLLFLGAGCSRFFLKKDAYEGVKKAAVVQYAINPRTYLGTAASNDVRMAVALGADSAFLNNHGNWQYEGSGVIVVMKSATFRLAAGWALSDTQTGLRGIPASVG